MFDQLAEYTIPVLHPVLVHFPIALSIVAVVTALFWVIRAKTSWWKATLFLEIMALVGAIVAVRTGDVMRDQSEGVMIVDQFVDLHETMGDCSIWLLVVAIVLLVAMRWIGVRETKHAGVRLRWRLIAFIAVLSAAVLTGITGHIGGLMTWGVPV